MVTVREWKEVEGWTVNTIMRNKWRVPYMDVADFMQEAKLVHLFVAQRYVEVEAAHFFALYRTTFINKLHELSRKSSGKEVGGFTAKTDFVADLLDSVDHVDIREDIEFNLFIEKIPAEIKALVFALMSDKPPRRKRSYGIREKTNDYWCRIGGFDSAKIDLVKWMRDLFTGQSVDVRDVAAASL